MPTGSIHKPRIGRMDSKPPITNSTAAGTLSHQRDGTLVHSSADRSHLGSSATSFSTLSSHARLSSALTSPPSLTR